MSGHIDIERMHDLIDGLVPSVEAEADVAHLGACDECRDEYARLEAVVAELRGLPDEARAPEGLWAGIEARLGEPAVADVVPFPGKEDRARRRFAFTVPQLAAAAVVVSVLSAGTVWMALSGGATGAGSTPGAAALAEQPLGADPGAAARLAASGDVAYESALLELQDLVEANRDLMAPETVAALDQSLATIDEAMVEIRRALRDDPNSELLARLLVNQQRSKLRVLRQAAAAVQARS